MLLNSIKNISATGSPIQTMIGYIQQRYTLDIAPLRSETPPQKRSGMARVLTGSQFYLHTHTFIGMSHTCLCLSSHSWYSFTDPGGMEG